MDVRAQPWRRARPLAVAVLDLARRDIEKTTTTPDVGDPHHLRHRPRQFLSNLFPSLIQYPTIVIDYTFMTDVEMSVPIDPNQELQTTD